MPAADQPSPPVLSAVAAAAHRLPAPASWRYDVRGERRGQPWEGTSELAWRHDGSAYDAAWTLRRADDRVPHVLRSIGRLDAGGLSPERFSVRTRGETAAYFMVGDAEIRFSAQRVPAPLQDGAQDRLSVLLQLAARLAGDAAVRTPGTRFVVQTAGARGAATWHFRVEASPGTAGEEPSDAAATGPTAGEAVAAGAGAIRLVRVNQGLYEPQLEAWFAPRLDYAPARVRLTLANGDWTDHRWSGTDTP